MAHNLFISYDLMSPGQNYETIGNAIKALGSWAKVHYSLFYVSSNLSSEEAAKRIRPVMDQNDKLIVIEAREAYWFMLPDEVSQQIQTHWNL